MSNLPNYYQIGKKLSIRFPELAQKLSEEEVVCKEWESNLPALFSKFKAIRPEVKGKKDQTRRRMEFVAIIVMYLDCDALYSNRALKRGIRTALSNLLQCNSCEISNTLKTVRNHLVIYKDFQQAVEYLYSELFD